MILTATEHARVVSVRLERLAKLGVSGSLAILAAELRDLDLYSVERLVRLGADPVTALRIYWPLDHQGLHSHGDQSEPLATK